MQGKNDIAIPIDNIQFIIRYCHIDAGDVTPDPKSCSRSGWNPTQGVSIIVEDNIQQKQLLRFDCFRVAPHYYYRNATVKKNERLMLDFTAEGDALAWTMGKIKNRLPTMLLHCEADEIARNIDQRDADAVIPKIVAWAETKTHRRG